MSYGMSLDRLRQVAETATEGPWQRLPNLRDIVSLRGSDGGSTVVGYAPTRRNAEFVATFDPVLVQALLDVAQAAHRALTTTHPNHDEAIKLADDLADAVDRLREVTA